MTLTATNNTQLDVVDEADIVVGQASRADIHKQGLLHREVHVWFTTPDRQLIFQKRTPKKDTFPGLLDATVGGHVELGQSYEEAALREIEEESGLKVATADLYFLGKYRGRAIDAITGSINNVQRAIYAYNFSGELEKLVIEEDAGAGFVAITIDDQAQPAGALRAQLIPVLLEPDYKAFMDKAAALSNASESQDYNP